MPRALLLCFTIVAAFQLRPAARRRRSTEVPVTAPVAALARSVGMDVARDRARFVPEIIRRVYSPPLGRQSRIDLGTAARGAADVAALPRVELPLSPALWSDAVFRRQIPADQLLGTISDRQARRIARPRPGRC